MLQHHISFDTLNCEYNIFKMPHLSLLCSFSTTMLALLSLSALSSTSTAQSVVQACTSYSGSRFVCMHRYASLMPPVFQRVVVDDIRHADTFPSTEIPSDGAFEKVANATFLIWDEKRAAEVLGSNPTYDFIFRISDAAHEAPV